MDVVIVMIYIVRQFIVTCLIIYNFISIPNEIVAAAVLVEFWGTNVNAAVVSLPDQVGWFPSRVSVADCFCHSGL